MDTKTIINKAMKTRKTNQSKLCKLVGMIQQQLSRNINQPQSIRVKVFLDIMNTLGYEVIVRDKYSGEEMVCDTDTQE